MLQQEWLTWLLVALGALLLFALVFLRRFQRMREERHRRVDIPEEVVLLMGVVKGDREMRRAFASLEAADPVRRREILSSWLNTSETLADIDKREVLRFLHEENGFRAALEVLRQLDSEETLGRHSA